MTELKNCPFCGSEAKLVNEFHVHYAICLNDKCVTFGPNGATEAEAIAAWNKRTYDVAELAQVEAVQRLVEAANPFVELAKQIVTSKADNDPIWGYRDAGLTYGDFRKIATALAAFEVSDAK